MNKAYIYVCQNGGNVNISNLFDKSHASGIRRPNCPGGQMKLRLMLETYGKSHFTLEDTSKDLCIVHAIPKSRQNAGKVAVTRHNSNFPKTFKLANGTSCHYITDLSTLDKTVESILSFLSKTTSETETQFISVDCEGAPEDLQLIQIATRDAVYIFDCQRIDKEKVCHALKPIFSTESSIKLIHDLHHDVVALKIFGNIDLVGTIDTQLLAEFIWGNPFIDLNTFLSRLELPTHPSKEFVKGRMKSGVDLWSKRPIAQTSLEYAAMDVSFLQSAAEEITKLVTIDEMQNLIRASSCRLKNAITQDGSRAICFDTKNCHAIASAELISIFRSHEGFFGEILKIESNVEEVFSILPSVYKKKFVKPIKQTNIMKFLKSHDDGEETEDRTLPIQSLSDIVLDIGRRPQCWIQDSRIFLCDDELKVVEETEIKEISTNLGRFGSDNRAGLNGQLHRFSAMRDREDHVMGITIRVGRNVHGNAAMLMDLLMSTDKSILILGEPGSGKTTIVREATRKLAEDKNVIVVDTSNEIAGDGTTPHSCIGLARRMMVPSLDQQSSVMVECVQNHTPHVMVIDEIGRPKEVQAARTVKQRGVRIIASAHGDLRRLLKNKDLVGLLGGLQSVTIGDDLAKEEAERKQKLALKRDGEHRSLNVSKTKIQRGGEPTFEVIVEVSRGSRHDWKIVYDSAKAVDQILDGLRYQAHLRTRNPETGDMRMEFVDG